MPHTQGYANLRKGRVSQPGRPYHVIISTQNRANIFSTFQSARLMTLCLKQSEQVDHSNMLAFVIMPDHVHWLLTLNATGISKCVQRVKSQFSRQSGLKVWNAGFYDHAIRSQESLQGVARYIIANPVRAGLVKRVGDYPHWDAVWL